MRLKQLLNETNKVVNQTPITEAEKIKLGELDAAKQKQVGELQKLFGGKIITIWDSVHGNIVDIKVTEKNGRLIASDLKDLIALKIRWVEFDNQTVSIGF
jgi:hypothetical protein